MNALAVYAETVDMVDTLTDTNCRYAECVSIGHGLDPFRMMSLEAVHLGGQH
jgi:hypothetical protein